MRAITPSLLFPLCLAPTLAGAQLNISLGDRSIKVNNGSTLECSGNVIMSNAANRIWLNGVLRVNNPSTTAFNVSAGGIVNEYTGTGSGVVWNMNQAATYSLPFVNGSAQPIPLVITPTSAFAGTRDVSASTYASASNNTPTPFLVSNTQINGSEGSTLMADRFWSLSSSQLMDATVAFNHGTSEDATAGTTAMQARQWFLGTWNNLAANQVQTGQRQVTGTVSFAASNRHWVLAQEPGVLIAPRIFLDGPYVSGTGMMGDGLRANNLIPLTEPYTAMGVPMSSYAWPPIQSSVLAITGGNAIVDWVLVDLHSSMDAAQRVMTKAALLQRDGDVVELDGISALRVPASAGSYYVAIRHRNHFGCMTAAPIALSGAITSLDLTQPGTATYGLNARKSNSGVMTLWSGNVMRDAMLKYTGASNDRDPILSTIGGVVPTNTVAGYALSDVNMDGSTKYTGSANDRDPILSNIGGSVPTNTLTEQLP
ncbi:MAG: hypothetical protein IPM68_04360 [Flavobacteriales bacterium]|nr:hypothetical protein [Flavobacteriales bacterium]